MEKRILVPLAEGFEMIEALSIVDVFRRGGGHVDHPVAVHHRFGHKIRPAGRECTKESRWEGLSRFHWRREIFMISGLNFSPISSASIM